MRLRRLAPWLPAFLSLAVPGTAIHARDAVGAAAITFDTAGGDTWRFDREISGHVRPGACISVVVESPAGDARAILQGSRFAARIHLLSGVNAVRAACRRRGAPALESRAQHWNVRLEDHPRAWIHTRVSGEMVLLDGGATEVAAGLPAPVATYQWRADPHNPAALAVTESGGKHIQFSAPGIDGEYRITLHVTDTLGRTDDSTTLFRVSKGHAVEVDIASTPPEWLGESVVYGAAPSLLTPVGFEGVARRLDAIAALGANVVWLTPITAAPAGDFGYAVTNHFKVRDTFGSEAQLHALVDAAHAHGLKVLLDFVTNHLSNAHPYYLDAERRGTHSPYYGWFERDPSGQVVHYFDWTNLENLDYDNPDVRAYMIAACAYWLRTYHVDGFRMDAAWAVRERAPGFWPRLRRELKRIDPDVVLLAEASALDPYYRTHGFDAAYDWTTHLGEWAWQAAYANGTAAPNLDALRAALITATPASATGLAILRFLDNNDTGARFVTRHGLDQTRTAAALLLTLPGLPLVFEGDEVGAAFDPYRGGPPVVWRDPDGLEPFYARLVKLRHDIAALRSSSMEVLDTDHNDVVLAYLRYEDGADEPAAVVVINFGDAPMGLPLAQAESRDSCNSRAAVEAAAPVAHRCLVAVIAGRAWQVRDLITGASSQVGAQASTLRLLPHDALLLRPPLPTN